MKIGLGLITYNRFDNLRKIYPTIPFDMINEMIVVNDGDPLPSDIQFTNVIQNDKNYGVGISKNKAFKYLLVDKNCDFIFMMEDDILIKDKNVFNEYIKLSNFTGVEHFNCCYNHPLLFIVNYNDDIKLDIRSGTNAFFSFYTKNCLDNIGFMDSYYYNSFEHVDHTFLAGHRGFTTPFHYFCDIHDSFNYLEIINCDSKCGDENFKIRSIQYAHYFKEKYGFYVSDVPLTSVKKLKEFLQWCKDTN